jgi:CRP-like cAMP-binding protein
VLKSSKVFRFNFSHEFLKKLSLTLKEATFRPGETIFRQYDPDFRIFYIFKGQIELFIEKPMTTDEALFDILEVIIIYFQIPEEGSLFYFSNYYISFLKKLRMYRPLVAIYYHKHGSFH